MPSKICKVIAQDSLGDTADIFSAFTDIINKFTESGVSNFGKFWEELDPTEKASMILQGYRPTYERNNLYYDICL